MPDGTSGAWDLIARSHHPSASGTNATASISIDAVVNDETRDGNRRARRQVRAEDLPPHFVVSRVVVERSE